MSRVIKFRAWNLTYKWMEDDFYIGAGDGLSYDTPSRTYDTPNIEIEEQPDYVVMQFTGLLDANGVEVYEGDITEKTYLTEAAYSSGKHVRGDIVFHEQSFFERYTHGDGDVYYDKIDDCKVVGNIYQNKELLSCAD